MRDAGAGRESRREIVKLATEVMTAGSRGDGVRA